MDKLDKIADDITAIKVTLAVNTASLEEHVKRTNLLEDSLKPIHGHITRVEGAVKLVVALSAIAAFLKTMGLI